MNKNYPVIIGINEIGCASLANQSLEWVSGAQVLVGHQRFLDFFPEFSGETLTLPMPQKTVGQSLQELVDISYEKNIVILASGDPNFFGIAKLARRYFQQLTVIPNLSNIQLAFAKIHQSWDDAKFVSLHGRSLQGLANRIRNHHKICIFTDHKNTPSVIAKHLIDFHQDSWQAYVCEDLGPSTSEKITFFDTLQELAKHDHFSPLLLLILLRKKNSQTCHEIHLDEKAYEHKVFKKGFITKREVRIQSIVNMCIGKDSTIWDVGAASGSVAIEAAKIANQGHVFAVEVDSKCLKHLHTNIRKHQTDNITIVDGLAPQILDTIDINPDAIFIGGSKGNLSEMIHSCFERLNRPGKLVINAITLENINTCYQELKKLAKKEVHRLQQGIVHDYLQVCLLQTSRSLPLASYLRYEALNPVHIFTLHKAK